MRLLVSIALLPLATSVVVGCTSGGPGEPGESAAAVTSEELARAKAVTSLVKARCATCHTAGKAEVRRWGAAMQAVHEQCLSAALPLTPAERALCLRSDPTNPASSFTEAKLGFYALATTHTRLKSLLVAAGGDDLHAQLVQQASMPPAGAPVPGFDEAEVAKLEAWVLAGMPALDEAMAEAGATCVATVSPKLAAHVEEMRVAGWAARHLDGALPMHGCGAEREPSRCLAAYGDVTSSFGAAAVPQTLRKIYELPFSTYAWTRTSPDGRFAAYGGQPARVVNLAAAGGPKIIRVAAEFDPAFLPDNSGFSFANTSGSRVNVCRQSVLLSAAAQPSPSLAMTEPGCNTMTSADYQAIGASLDGTLFLMASGTHENDVAFSMTHGPLSGSFGASAVTNVLPMLSTGTGYVERPRITLAHPFEGDGGLSPSSRLFYTRFGSAAGKRGYKIRKLTPRGLVSPAAGGGLSLETEEIATLCGAGGKPLPSFDERFVVTHQYVDPAEAGGMPANSANVILFDLATGETIRLTSFARGQYAFSPHFRADGWIYFLLKDANTRKETLLASDAAIRRL